MPRTCCIKGCSSESVSGCGISFHSIPKNEELREKWRCVIPAGKFTKNSVVCSSHFKHDDFREYCSRKYLQPNAIPSIFSVCRLSKSNQLDIEDSGDEVNDDETDEDDKNLSTLKMLLAKGSQFEPVDTDAAEIDEDGEADGIEGDVKRQPQNLEKVMSCCHPTEMKNVGTQAERKTNKEMELQAKVRILGRRVARRDAKISYMKTVFQMIKKIVKGTDMENKLCCELYEIAAFPEANFKIPDQSGLEISVVPTQGTEHSLDFIDKKIDESESSGDEAGAFVEVAFSPNLRPRHGV